jgi:hypothetical protein
LTQSDPFAVTVYTLKLTHPASPPLALQASASPVAGKRARSATPSLVGGRRAKPAGAGPVAPLPPARTSNRLRPSSTSGSPRPPLVRVAPSARLPLQREARAARLAARAESTREGVLHGVNTDPFDDNRDYYRLFDRDPVSVNVDFAVYPTGMCIQLLCPPLCVSRTLRFSMSFIARAESSHKRHRSPSTLASSPFCTTHAGYLETCSVFDSELLFRRPLE